MKHNTAPAPRIIIITVLISIAVIGSIFAVLSHAATSTVAAEAETGTIKTPAVKISDTGASAGSSVKFSPAIVTPPSTGSWPSSWDDPLFANVKNFTQNPYNMSGTTTDISVTSSNGDPLIGCSNFNVQRFRGRGREGIRLCSNGNVTVSDFYMEITGQGDDHGDGVQAYGGSSMPNVKLKNGNIVLRGAANAGIFLADNAHASLTLENIRVDAQGAPNGALFFANSGNDIGVTTLSLSNVLVSPSVRFVGGSSFNVTKWDNVRYFDGSAVPRP